MGPPSPLAIATSSVLRLVKEESSYHKELLQQEARIQKLEQQDKSVEEDNVEYMLNQEVDDTAYHATSPLPFPRGLTLEETRAVFPPLKQRIADALAKLEDQLEAGTESAEELTKAKDAVAAAKQCIRETAAV
ncbi:hypothetical protein FGG08_006651 [Glutinoglossum americanum]|uniref:Tubulin-specific chaperone A n=1 Tax=Glutinoglossum americanum TaxID=1670608 RepID=A0A9P8L1P3_9PEZI|nr:hypothetical protein FGG08_006651 [Glutinoglossum americanum]